MARVVLAVAAVVALLTGTAHAAELAQYEPPEALTAQVDIAAGIVLIVGEGCAPQVDVSFELNELDVSPSDERTVGSQLDEGTPTMSDDLGRFSFPLDLPQRPGWYRVTVYCEQLADEAAPAAASVSGPAIRLARAPQASEQAQATRTLVQFTDFFVPGPQTSVLDGGSTPTTAGEDLPRTGSDVGEIARLGLLAVGLGALVVYAARQRRRAFSPR